jgi:hypothetical protein
VVAGKCGAEYACSSLTTQVPVVDVAAAALMLLLVLLCSAHQHIPPVWLNALCIHKRVGQEVPCPLQPPLTQWADHKLALRQVNLSSQVQTQVGWAAASAHLAVAVVSAAIGHRHGAYT